MAESEVYKTVWIAAKYAEIMENKKISTKVGTRIVKKYTGILQISMKDVEEDVIELRDNWVGTGRYSDKRIDTENLSKRIGDVCNKYWLDGYELFSIISTIRGMYDFDHKYGTMTLDGREAYGYGYGYSITDGVILTFRQRLD